MHLYPKFGGDIQQNSQHVTGHYISASIFIKLLRVNNTRTLILWCQAKW